MELASKALSDLGLPLASHSEFQLKVRGDFEAQGHHYRVTRDESAALSQHLVIYPQSFTTLSDDELIATAPSHIESSRCSMVLIPSTPALYASLIRMMLRYTCFNRTLLALHTDVSELITYHLLESSDGFVDIDDDDEWESKEYDRRISDAWYLVRSWGVDQVWRGGEEWIGDALAEIVKTGQIQSLPCKP